ncbi:MAG: glycosyltransferase [Phototrophicaceae bacterium]
MSYNNYERWKTEPTSDHPYVSIVIPAYNESQRIVPTVGAIASYVSDLGFEWELIVADDGSKDQTVAMLEELGLVNLHVLKAQKNGGKGSAVRRGMLAARGKYVLFTDADNSTPIENITPVLTKLATESYDVAVGSRAAEGASEGNKSALRQFLSDSLRMMVRVVLGIQVKDTQCGFKMYTQEAAKRLHGALTHVKKRCASCVICPSFDAMTCKDSMRNPSSDR